MTITIVAGCTMASIDGAALVTLAVLGSCGECPERLLVRPSIVSFDPRSLRERSRVRGRPG